MEYSNSRYIYSKTSVRTALLGMQISVTVSRSRILECFASDEHTQMLLETGTRFESVKENDIRDHRNVLQPAESQQEHKNKIDWLDVMVNTSAMIVNLYGFLCMKYTYHIIRMAFAGMSLFCWCTRVFLQYCQYKLRSRISCATYVSGGCERNQHKFPVYAFL